MNLIARIFTLSALTSMASLIILALWATWFAWRGQTPNRDWQLGCVALQITQTILVLSFLMLWLEAKLSQPTTTLAYVVMAVFTIPSVWAYLPKEFPGQHSSSLALACLFATGMVFRALQSA
jgi:hypothetical protein